MSRPHCPDHGDLVRELALGLLGDDEATAAEEALRNCAACASWWANQVAPHAAALEGPVREALSGFRAPRRHSTARWWTAAAAALVLAATGALWVTVGDHLTAPSSQRAATVTPAAVRTGPSAAVPEPGEAAATDRGESGLAPAEEAVTSGRVDQPATAGTGEIFSLDFEQPSAVAQRRSPDRPLLKLDFESGALPSRHS